MGPVIAVLNRNIAKGNLVSDLRMGTVPEERPEVSSSHVSEL